MPKHFVAYGGEPPHYYLIYGVYDTNEEAESDARRLDDLIVQGQIINIDNDITERCIRAESKIKKIQEKLDTMDINGDTPKIWVRKVFQKIISEDST